MKAPSYKWARDKIPQYILERFDNLDANEVGDLWRAVDVYLIALEEELEQQYRLTGVMINNDLLNWLKTRPWTLWCDGPVIIESDVK